LISATSNKKKEGIDMSKDITFKEITRILENQFWIPELSTEVIYSRIEDDCDGDFTKKLTVEFNCVGDVLTNTGDRWPPLRFRMPGMLGGGRSPRTRNALMILALAMKLDNEEKPDPD
jgi:hypothetical protein